MCIALAFVLGRIASINGKAFVAIPGHSHAHSWSRAACPVITLCGGLSRVYKYPPLRASSPSILPSILSLSKVQVNFFLFQNTDEMVNVCFLSVSKSCLSGFSLFQKTRLQRHMTAFSLFQKFNISPACLLFSLFQRLRHAWPCLFSLSRADMIEKQRQEVHVFSVSLPLLSQKHKKWYRGWACVPVSFSLSSKSSKSLIRDAVCVSGSPGVRMTKKQRRKFHVFSVFLPLFSPNNTKSGASDGHVSLSLSSQNHRNLLFEMLCAFLARLAWE